MAFRKAKIILMKDNFNMHEKHVFMLVIKTVAESLFQAKKTGLFIYHWTFILKKFLFSWQIQHFTSQLKFGLVPSCLLLCFYFSG